MKSRFPSITTSTSNTKKRLRLARLQQTTGIEGFDMNQLEEVVQSFKNKKAAGPDGLKPFVLKELSKNKKEELLLIYKTMIILQCTQTQ